MPTTARDPLVSYCSELASPRDRHRHPLSVEYAEPTLRALTVLARRYDTAQDRKKANPVWVDADGVERAAALQEAIVAWEREELPPSLLGHRLLRLEYAAVMDGVDVGALNDWHAQIRARYPLSMFNTDFERDPALAEQWQQRWNESDAWLRSNVAYQRLLAVLEALYAAYDAGAPAILYVDHLHRLLGGSEGYPFDLMGELKPLLYRCEIQLWGACTFTEYRAWIECLAPMQRCFQEIILPRQRSDENVNGFASFKAWH